MSKRIYIISSFVIFLCIGRLNAQEWYFLEQDQGVCAVDSLIITDSLYFSLFDTIEHYWLECEFSRKPCIAYVSFTNKKNHLLINVFQIVEIYPIVISCYMTKIYGGICYNNHQYYFGASHESLIDKNALKKSGSTFVSDYFLSQTYRDLIFNTDFLERKVIKEKKTSRPVDPFENEWKGEVYDKLRFEIYLSEDGVVCTVLESCQHTDDIHERNH